MGVTWTDYYDKDYKDTKGKPVTFTDWYESHSDVSHYHDRFTKAINRLRYKSGIWKRVQEEGLRNLKDGNFEGWDRVYRFVNDVRKLAGYTPMAREFFDEGIRYRDIFHKDYEYAREEFRLLCWGDW